MAIPALTRRATTRGAVVRTRNPWAGKAVRPHLVLALFALAAGAALVRSPTIITALALAAACVLASRAHWTVGFFLVGYWPLLLLGPGKAGLALAAVGVLLWAQLVKGGLPRLLVDGWHDRAGIYVLLAGLLVAYAIVVSLPLTHEEVPRAVLGVFACLPMFLAGAGHPTSPPYRWVVALGTPLALLLLVDPTAPPFRNPILTGNALWIVAACALLDDGLPRWVKAAVVGLTTYGLIKLPALGPVVAAVSATGFFILQRIRFAGLARDRRSAKLAYAGLALGALALGGLAYARYQSLSAQPRFELNNIAARQTIYKVALSHLTPVGHGLRELVEQLPGRYFALNNAHNFFLDAAYVAGVIGVVVPLVLSVYALLGALRSRSPAAGVFIGIIVSQCFSGGIFESPVTWYAFGALLALGATGGRADGDEDDGDEEAPPLAVAGPGPLRGPRQGGR